MTSPSEAVADYIEALVSASDRCVRSEDRLAYTKHLAAAAEMSVAAHRGNLDRLVELLAGEERHFGWSYLDGDAGKSAEEAFHELARTIRSLAGG
jgi:hypothetical protein